MDGNIWDSMDSDEAGFPDECVDVKLVWRWKVELDNNRQHVRKDMVVDYTQHEVNDITEKF